MILAGDIGGTNTRVALFNGDPRVPVALEVYPSASVDGLEEALRRFLRAHPAEVVGAAFGVAGPVVDGRSSAVNLAWAVDAELVAETLGLPAVGLLNDLEANAQGLAALAGEDLAVLCAGAEDPDGNIAVVSAGTGLGIATVSRRDGHVHVVPGEGGHADFAPADTVQLELWSHLHARFGHVSNERVLSGQGIENLYEFVVASGRGEPLSATPNAKAITTAGLAGTSATGRLVLDLFASIYGAVAGNVALTVLATGGVYLGGGIAPRLIAKLDDGTFMRAFRAKGRLAPVLDTIPVHVVLNDKTALIGAARAAAAGGAT